MALGAAEIIEDVERFLSDQGFSEMGSDSEIENRIAHASHLAWGFVEAERVVCFRRSMRRLVR